jgi:hypothetical protein
VTGKDQDLPLKVTETEEAERGQGLLARWSQRKLEGETGAATPSEAPEPAEVASVGTPESLEAALTDADMPPLESLGEDSDYRGFLSPKVSEALRKAALRKLFRQSRFNAVDGLDDYAEDYTSFEPLGDLVTHEMRRMLERARKALEEGGEAEPAAAPEAAASGAEPVEEPAPEVTGPLADGQDASVNAGEVR